MNKVTHDFLEKYNLSSHFVNEFELTFFIRNTVVQVDTELNELRTCIITLDARSSDKENNLLVRKVLKAMLYIIPNTEIEVYFREKENSYWLKIRLTSRCQSLEGYTEAVNDLIWAREKLISMEQKHNIPPYTAPTSHMVMVYV